VNVIKMDIASVVKRETDLLPKLLAEAVVGKVESDFIGLLLNAPQKSGNYVANFAVAAGSRVGGQSAGEYFPPNPTNAQIVKRGSHAAIAVAMRSNSNLKKNLTRHIVRGATWWGTSLTVYNKLDYGEKVEAYTRDQLRDVNKGGEHAMQKLKTKLERSLNVGIRAGNIKFDNLITVTKT